MPRRRFLLRKLPFTMFVGVLAFALLPRPVAGQDDEAIRAAVLRGIAVYLGQLDGACFAQDISIGELGPFQTAINKSLNRFIVGADGAAWLKANSNNAKSSHHAWRGIGLTANIIFPFDPRSPDLKMENRQTMMHEMTHHIEWLQGVKEASRSVMGTPNPNSERNTEYQDKIIDALMTWKQYEDEIRQNPNALNVEAWKNLETSLRDVTAGAAAGGNPHDGNLKSMTGIEVSFDTIRATYLDGKCGKQFRALVLVAESTGRVDRALQFEGPNSATVGETVTLAAGAYNRLAKSDADHKVAFKPELGATFRWKVPDVSAVVGNPIKFAPAEAKPYEIPVALTVRHDGQDYVIAQGHYDIIVEPKKTATEPPPEKPPVEKPPAPKPPTEKPPVEKPAHPPSTPAGAGGASPSPGDPLNAHWKLTEVKDARARCGAMNFEASNCTTTVTGTAVRTQANFRRTWIPLAGYPEPPWFAVESTGSWTDLPKTVALGSTVNTTLTATQRGVDAANVDDFPLFLTMRGDATVGGRGLQVRVEAGRPESVEWQLPGGYVGTNKQATIEISHNSRSGGVSRTYIYTWTPGPPAGDFDVTVTADRPAPKLGETVTLSAGVTGGTPPYQYTWTGPVTGRTSALSFPVSKPGRHDFIVTVVDAKGAKTSAAARVEAKAFYATITPAGGVTRVPIGKTLSFTASVSASDGSAPPSGLVYRWEPSTDVRFTPFEGTERSSAGTFPRVGKVRVWVDVLQRDGAVLSTLTESNQLDIEVVPPTVTLRASPAQPYPGQEVRILASEAPPVDEAFLTYWWEHAGNVLNPGGFIDPRVYSLRPRDTTPVKVIAHAKAIIGGDDLGATEIVVTARAHDVRVSEPQARGPKPRIWDPKRDGLVEVDTGLAVFQDVSLRAEVTPAPANPPLRYEWAISPDGCSISNPISQEPTFNCSQTGTFSAMVTVRDSLGATLGTGRGQLPITISQAALQSARDQVDAAKQREDAAAAQKQFNDQVRVATARRLVDEGIAMQKQGLLREAAAKYRESLAYATVDPNLEKIIAQLDAEAARREQAAAQLATAQRLVTEGIAFQKQGLLREAAAKYRESLKYAVVDPNMEKIIAQLDAEASRREQAAAQQATAEAQKQAADQARLTTADRLRKEGSALQQQGKLLEAAAKYRESLPYYPDPGLERLIDELEAEARKRETAPSPSVLQASCSLSGEWVLLEDLPPGQINAFSLRQTGTALVGTKREKGSFFDASYNVAGSVSGRDVRITVSMKGLSGETLESVFVGSVSADCKTLDGSQTFQGTTTPLSFRRGQAPKATPPRVTAGPSGNEIALRPNPRGVR